MLGDDFVEPGLRLESPSGATETMEGFRWRLNRLRCMTPVEVSHRLLRTLSMRAERAGLLGSGVVPAPDLALKPRPWVHAAVKADAAPYLAAADRVAAGELDIFALPARRRAETDVPQREYIQLPGRDAIGGGEVGRRIRFHRGVHPGTRRERKIP